jgi:adenosylcobinamide-GDP ribazoletransferase
MMCAFPLVGLVLGAACAGFILLCGYWELPDAVRALGLTLIPLALTGGIHLDGLADTADALASRAEPERMRAILKDPRVGSFGVIALIVYLVSVFALALALPAELTVRQTILFGWGFVYSRTLSAAAVLNFPNGSDGLNKTFSDSASKGARKLMNVIVSAAIVITVCLPALTLHEAYMPFRNASAVLRFIGIMTPLAAVPVLLYTYLSRTAKRRFGGMSGDLAGWFLCRCEAAYLAVFALGMTFWK